ncbi:HEAT repeat domain-containing protein [Streptomyces sp. GbtcB6]|uniref:HEAT repeat domain-containing protein n=1 Tax=Streptomyces sp. GbtcB6 TaxID=2824751 RepID=UPI001C2F1D38|nr:HEAT repeat domain-containing protein [Streptomyces sp. GbtcB6]
MREEYGDGEAVALRLAEGAAPSDVFDGADPLGWLALDAGARSWRLRDALPSRAEIDGERRDALTESRAALALCHGDGRIRAAALERAARFPGLLPLVVVRCADWVAPVRERARDLLRETLDADAAVPLAPLVLLLGRRGRGDFAVEVLGDVLRGASHEQLGRLRADGDRTVRRFAHRLAVAEGRLSAAELARAAAQDSDPTVQTLCAEAAVALLPEGADADDVLGPLLAARGPRVRSIGVTALRRAGRPERAADFLADRSGVVRACARYVVRQYGTDPLPWYRRRVTDAGDPALPSGAVVGLAECGARADAELLVPLLAHPSPAVRAGAVAGLRILDVTDVRRFRELLDDPAPGVVREATVSLLPSAGSLDAGWLMDRLAAGRARHARVAAFRLLDGRGGLVRLRAAVALLDDPDVKLRGWAERSVRQWHPTPDVPLGSEEAAALLERAGLSLCRY